MSLFVFIVQISVRTIKFRQSFFGKLFKLRRGSSKLLIP